MNVRIALKINNRNWSEKERSEMNSLTKMNLCEIIFHVKFSIKNMLIKKQKLILTKMGFFVLPILFTVSMIKK